MNILVTGGAGYIGTHTTIDLINNGHEVVIVDNLVNSSEESVKRVELITGRKIPFFKIDVRDSINLDKLFSTHKIDAVIHFAGLKSVGKSVSNPIEYYDNNIMSTLSLISTMKKHSVRKLVFSSSATVYGTPNELPVSENCQTGVGITNPYGRTKYMIEQILIDLSNSDPLMEICLLRYFNPVGAHSSGLIGEDPNGTPNNLLPFVSQVAIGKLKELKIFGDDYDTPDGTGVRDYIHVSDLASGHVAALNHIKTGVSIYNLGTGKGVSVIDIVNNFERVSGKKIPYVIAPRRPGDVASCYASTEKARKELGWTSEKSLEDACRDSWNWQQKNPNGYKEDTHIV